LPPNHVLNLFKLENDVSHSSMTENTGWFFSDISLELSWYPFSDPDEDIQEISHELHRILPRIHSLILIVGYRQVLNDAWNGIVIIKFQDEGNIVDICRL
jgi:hypothetical protein